MTAVLDAMVFFGVLFLIFGAIAAVCWVCEVLAWRLEQRRRRRERLPDPEWRARVHRRWQVPL